MEASATRSATDGIALEAPEEPSREPDPDEVEAREANAEAIVDDLCNIYSFAMTRLLHPAWRPSKKRTRAQIVMQAQGFTLRFLGTVAGLLALLFTQMVLVFAFSDSSLLKVFLATYPEGNPSILPSWVFYPDTTMSNGVPAVIIFTSVVAMLLLAYHLKEDTYGTLLTPSPLDPLFNMIFCPPAPPSPATLKPTDGCGATGRRVLHALLCVPLQLLVSVRCAILPALACFGSAVAFSGSRDAQEIVLNSVAIAFVVELDEIVFGRTVPPAARAKYRGNIQAWVVEVTHSHPHPYPHPLTLTLTLTLKGHGERAYTIVSAYAVVLFAVDALFMCLVYFRINDIGGGDDVVDALGYDGSSLKYIIRVLPLSQMVTRGCITGFAQAHLSLSRWHSRPPLRSVLYVLVCVGAGFAFALLTNTLIVDGILRWSMGFGTSWLTSDLDDFLRTIVPEGGVTPLGCLMGTDYPLTGELDKEFGSIRCNNEFSTYAGVREALKSVEVDFVKSGKSDGAYGYFFGRIWTLPW